MTSPLREISFKLSVDRNAINQSIQGIDLLDRRLSDLGNTTKLSGAELRKAFSGGAGTTALRNVGNQAKQAAADVGRLRDALSKAGQEAEKTGKTKINIGGALQAGAQVVGGPAGEALRLAGDVKGLAESFGGLSKVTIGLGIGIAAATVAINLYNAEVQRQKDILNDEIQARRDLARFQKEATSEQARLRLAAALDEQKIIADQLKFIEQRAGEALFSPTLDTGLKAQQEVYQELQKELIKNQTSVDLLSKALFGGAFAANDLKNAQEEAAKAAADLAKKERELRDARNISDAKTGIQRTLDIQELIRNGTLEEVQTRQQRLEEEKRLTQATITELKAAGTPYEEFAARVVEIDQELNALGEAEKGIKTRDSLKAVGDGIKSIFGTLFNTGKNIVEGVASKLAERNTKLASAVQEYDQDVASIEQNSLERRAEIQKDYNDKLVEIARDAAKAADDALSRLQDRRAELARDFAKGEQDAARKGEQERFDAVVDAQRQERDAYRDHLKRLEDIRRDAQRAEEDAILNRDFSALFRIRRDTGDNLNDANRDFIQERQARQQQLADRLTDLARQAEQERQQRLAQYQQNLADAQAQYIRDRQEAERQRQQALAEARNARNRQLQEERQAYQSSLQSRKAALVAELRMIADYGQQRIQLESQYLQRSLDILRTAQNSQTRINNFLKPAKMAAFGASLSGGEPAIVNEFGSSGRETFTGPGGTVALPGFGMFTPFSGGKVNANRGGVVLNQTNNITSGANAEAVAKLVEQRTTKLLENVLG